MEELGLPVRNPLRVGALLSASPANAVEPMMVLRAATPADTTQPFMADVLDHSATPALALALEVLPVVVLIPRFSTAHAHATRPFMPH